MPVFLSPSPNPNLLPSRALLVLPHPQQLSPIPHRSFPSSSFSSNSLHFSAIPPPYNICWPTPLPTRNWRLRRQELEAVRDITEVRYEPDIPVEEDTMVLHRMALRCSFILAFVLLSGLQVWGVRVDDLPGWMGENHVSRDSEGGLILQVASTDPTNVVQLSWKPRAFLHKHFLTDAECDHMIELAKDKLEKSMVADNESGKSVASEIRTSSGMFLMKGQDDIISRIEDKIATWTFLPKENGEAIQVLRYQDGEKYEPHFDYFHDKNNQALGGHRVATVLMYLSDVVKGGETVFPSSEDRGGPKDDTWSACGKTGVAVKPRKGDALLFFSLHPSAVPDESSLHTGCPVIEGEKWSATKWIHVLPFEKPRPKNGSCVNEDEKCEEWAAYGECQKNPAYMVGTKEWPGACRKACKTC